MPNVVAVAATGNTDNLAFFSNTGRRSVDHGAPGVDIYSTWPGGSYQYLSGTSMATPHVAGVAARFLQSNPTASPAAVRNAIVNAATTNHISGIPAGSGTANRLLFWSSAQ
jgi:subtilisin family serine protease